MSIASPNAPAVNSTNLPYEILQTACEVYAGKTGFTEEQMRAFFFEEVMKYRRSLQTPPDKNEPTWIKIFGAIATSGLDLITHPDFSTRAEALEYWLSQFPLARQRICCLNCAGSLIFRCGKNHLRNNETDWQHCSTVL